MTPAGTAPSVANGGFAKPVHTARPTGGLQYAIPFVIVAVVLALRRRRTSRLTPLRVERLWILPTLCAVRAVMMFVVIPPIGWGWAFCAASLGLGAAMGWQRGPMMRITFDPATLRLNQAASPAAILLLVALRSGARAALAGDDAQHLDTMVATDLSIALGLFTATRVEMYSRATRMLAPVARA